MSDAPLVPTVARRPVRTIYVSNPSRSARPLPESNRFERFMWYFMRISGLLLVVLALGHMLIMHVVVELSGQEINFELVRGRWGSPFWRIYDGLLLLLAMIHGVNGARIIIGDYVTYRPVRAALVTALAVVLVIWLVAGVSVIVFFNPNAA